MILVPPRVVSSNGRTCSLRFAALRACEYPKAVLALLRAAGLTTPEWLRVDASARRWFQRRLPTIAPLR